MTNLRYALFKLETSSSDEKNLLEAETAISDLIRECRPENKLIDGENIAQDNEHRMYNQGIYLFTENLKKKGLL